MILNIRITNSLEKLDARSSINVDQIQGKKLLFIQRYAGVVNDSGFNRSTS